MASGECRSLLSINRGSSWPLVGDCLILFVSINDAVKYYYGQEQFNESLTLKLEYLKLVVLVRLFSSYDLGILKYRFSF